MADALFDTTVFIDHYHGDPGAMYLFTRLTRGELKAYYSPITTLEIWVGIKTVQEEVDYSAMLSLMDEAPVTSAIARTASAWLRGQSPRRSDLLLRDALIAATATHHRLTLYSKNVRDFQRLHGDVNAY